MVKALLVATIGAVCWVAPLTAQDRPDFSGTWTLEPALSTPRGNGLFGTTFTATQDATTRELARKAFRLDGEIRRDRVASESRPPRQSSPSRIEPADGTRPMYEAAIERLAADEPDAPFSPDQFPADVQFRPKGEIEQQYRLLMMSPFTEPADVWPEFTTEIGAEAWAAFSRVLATSDGRDAVVYYEYWCGTLCGIGQLLWLHRDSATAAWRVAGRVTSWIS